MRTILPALAVALALSVLVPALAAGAGAPAAQLLGVEWQLTFLQAGGQPMENVQGAGLTITFGADGRVSGNGGCNSFAGTYTADTQPAGNAGTLAFSPLAATKRACADAAANDRETRYFATLQEVAGYVVDANALRLTFAQPDRQLVFVRPAAGVGAAQVSGTVTYLQRIALPPTAILTVQLLDVSRADAPAATIAEQTIPAGAAAPPYTFALAYTPAQIVATNAYAVRARIEVDGQLRFTSTQAYLVITQGRPSSGLVVVVDPVAGNPPTLPSSGGGGGLARGGGPLAWGLALLLGALLVATRRAARRPA